MVSVVANGENILSGLENYYQRVQTSELVHRRPQVGNRNGSRRKSSFARPPIVVLNEEAKRDYLEQALRGEANPYLRVSHQRGGDKGEAGALVLYSS